MPQRIQRTGVQVARLPCLLRTVRAEQIALLRVEIKRRIVILSAHIAAGKLRQKAALAHGAQLEHRLDDAQIRFLAADHVQAVEQKPKLLARFGAGRRERDRHLIQIHGKPHPLDGGRNSVENGVDRSLPDRVHIPPRNKDKFRVAKKPAGAE